MRHPSGLPLSAPDAVACVDIEALQGCPPGRERTAKSTKDCLRHEHARLHPLGSRVSSTSLGFRTGAAAAVELRRETCSRALRGGAAARENKASTDVPAAGHAPPREAMLAACGARMWPQRMERKTMITCHDSPPRQAAPERGLIPQGTGSPRNLVLQGTLPRSGARRDRKEVTARWDPNSRPTTLTRPHARRTRGAGTRCGGGVVATHAPCIPYALSVSSPAIVSVKFATTGDLATASRRCSSMEDRR